mgnify:CR=1 FL=1
MKRVINSEFSRFVIVGVINTVWFLLIARTLESFSVHPNIANLSGYIVGGTNSYVMNKFWSFKTTTSHRKELPTFIAVFIVCYFLNLGILNLSLSYVTLPQFWYTHIPQSIQAIVSHTLICQAIANVFYTLLSFTLYKTVVFRNHS